MNLGWVRMIRKWRVIQPKFMKFLPGIGITVMDKKLFHSNSR